MREGLFCPKEDQEKQKGKSGTVSKTSSRMKSDLQ